MIVLQILGLFLWLLLIPFCMGLSLVPLLKEKDRKPGVILLSGYLILFALFELIGIPVVLLVVYDGFSALCVLFAITCVLLAAAGVILTVRRIRKGQLSSKGSLSLKEQIQKTGIEEKICWLLFLLTVVFQLYMAFTRASFDGDDAYYNVQGVIAQQLDSLYRINPYTGRSAPLDVRHALALMPIWEAFVGKMSGIHTTIIAHSVIPLMMILLVYLMYFQIGKKLLSDKKDMLPMFMILISLFQMFGNVSIYTSETFFLTRTWQGKAMTGSLILPAVFWIFLCLFQEEKEEANRQVGYFLLLSVLNLAAGLSSSLAVLLSALLTAGLALLFAVKKRKFSILVKAGLSCIPSALYVLTYLIISH